MSHFNRRRFRYKLTEYLCDIKIMDEQYFQCDVKLIRPNRYQPRMAFIESEIEELCQSIREQGILQPLLIRGHNSGYELIAGERRLRAAKMAGLGHVPVVLKKVSDVDMLAMSIVENLQRKGLSFGHAKVLLGTDTISRQMKVWRDVTSKDLSVRETERLIRRLDAEGRRKPAPEPNSEEIYFSSVAEELSRNFGTKVQIRRQGQRGKVEIEFYSNDDLDRILGVLDFNTISE
ncbi:MAG: hypothetical protein B6245_23560 [Desulfobacteraceae bacterium 4572_88]|nr:MAG: hypothetical protein B6245_23560 [Desulfobacteraceae bacterium 4572_88]